MKITPGQLCCVEGCGSSVLARGMCGAHYKKWQTKGDPLAGKNRAKNGSGYIDQHGYHRRYADGKEKPEHVRIAEAVLGRPLPIGAQIHHIDKQRANNSNSNLVICPSDYYHKLLHMRLRALEECGNANSRKCCRCGEYDQPENLSISKSQAYHKACNAQHVARMIAKKKGDQL